MDEPVKGWTAPIYQALTTSHLLLGVPRLFGVLTFCGMVAVGLHFWPVLVAGVLLWIIVALCTRYDPHFLTIFLKHLGHASHYEA